MSISVLALHQQLTRHQHTGYAAVHDAAALSELQAAMDLTFDLVHQQVAILRELGHEPPDPDTDALQAPRVESLVLELLHTLLARYIHDAGRAGPLPLEPGQVKAMLTRSGWLPTMLVSLADVATVLMRASDDDSLQQLHASERRGWIGAYSWTLSSHLSIAPNGDADLPWVRRELGRLAGSLPSLGRLPGGMTSPPAVSPAGPAAAITRLLTDGRASVTEFVDQFLSDQATATGSDRNDLLRELTHLAGDVLLHCGLTWRGRDLGGTIEVAITTGVIGPSEGEALGVWFTELVWPRTTTASAADPGPGNVEPAQIRIALVAAILLLLSLDNALQALRPDRTDLLDALASSSRQTGPAREG